MENPHQIFERDSILSQGNDPNIGSARGTSTDSFISTLTLNVIIFTVITCLFFVFRKHNRRIYAPLTCVSSIESWRKLKYSDKTQWGIVDTVESLPGFSRTLGWILNVWKLPDETVLRTNGLDGYLFLRYLRQSMMLCFIGVFVTFILLPLNATGGGGQAGLDLLSFSNIGEESNKRQSILILQLETVSANLGHTCSLYVHVLVSYIYFGIILFVIYRELIFYIAIRQAYMHSDLYAPRLSARTLLVTAIPEKYQNEEALKSAFGPDVEHIWLNRHSPRLKRLVKRRDKVAMKLEEAEVTLIVRSDRQRRRAFRRGIDTTDPTSGGRRTFGGDNIVSRWLNSVKRPTHRVMWGKKVDTIDWCRPKLQELNRQVSERQGLQCSGSEGKLCNSAFIAFNSQSSAQSALRLVIHDLTIQMAPRYIGVSPGEVVWENLNIGFFERQVKVVATTAVFAVMTLFWSIPNALIGTISQLDYLAQRIPFLSIINRLPSFLVGAITGFLPPLLLSLLLGLVPAILMWLVRISGEPSRPNIELKAQNWYFIFLVIQVFLVTTITSAASAAATRIIKNPTSITNLLAENLPKASNFYISYMLLQGFSVSSSIIFQFAQLVLHKVLGRLFDNTPRKQWRHWSNVVDPGIGTLFPFYANCVVISLTYSVIAPLVLVFAALGLGLVYFAYRYNFLFVYNSTVDTKGLTYPRAWKHTLTGVYLCQGCMAGLFALKKQIGPTVLQLVLLACTIAFQKSLTANTTTLLEHLPDIPVATPGPTISPKDPEKVAVVVAFTQRTFSSFSKTASESSDAGSMLGRFFRPELYLDHRVLEKLVPRLDPEVRIRGGEDGYKDVYHHPSVTSTPPVIWVPQDAGGVAEREIEETGKVNPISWEGLVLDHTDGRILLMEDVVVPPDWEPEELWAV